MDLKFCGFETDVIVRDFMLTNTGVDDPYNLDKWKAYEEAKRKQINDLEAELAQNDRLAAEISK